MEGLGDTLRDVLGGVLGAVVGDAGVGAPVDAVPVVVGIVDKVQRSFWNTKKSVILEKIGHFGTQNGHFRQHITQHHYPSFPTPHTSLRACI